MFSEHSCHLRDYQTATLMNPRVAVNANRGPPTVLFLPYELFHERRLRLRMPPCQHPECPAASLSPSPPRSRTLGGLIEEKWIEHLKEKNYICYAVNSHNKKSVKELLSFLRAQIRDLKGEESNYTATLMLVGIPNVGKSALANAMHQTGRISAAEKGKLKHAVVSSIPVETKDISSYKIASHPNIYVLDTPGILRGEIDDAEAAAKLALTGAIEDCLVGEDVLAHYFLSILNSNGEYKCSLRVKVDVEPSSRSKKTMMITDSGQEERRRYPSDHTQVCSTPHRISSSGMSGKHFLRQFCHSKEIWKMKLTCLG